MARTNGRSRGRESKPFIPVDSSRSQDARHEAHVEQLTARNLAMLGFLRSRGLVDEFNAYEEEQRNAAGA